MKLAIENVTLPVSVANPKAQYVAYREEIDQAVLGVMNKGQYILGPEVDAFESEFAKYIGVSSAVGVASGSDAIYLALRALGIGAGDEVITVASTAVATVAAIEKTGATPVLIDIDKEYYSLSPETLAGVITSRTKAIVVVHLYGCVADMDSILDVANQNNIYVIEDCAQAHGALYKGRKAGAMGTFGCFSFYPTKNLGAIGDGGAVVSRDKNLIERIKLLREYGWQKKQSYHSETTGWNSRLDEMQAAILRVKLKYLDSFNQKRRNLARIYQEKLQTTNLILPKERENCFHVYHLYVVRSDQRDLLREFLLENKVMTNIHYPIPVHLQAGYKDLVTIPNPLNNSEKMAQQIFSLPLYPELVEDAAEYVADCILRFFDEN